MVEPRVPAGVSERKEPPAGAAAPRVRPLCSDVRFGVGLGRTKSSYESLASPGRRTFRGCACAVAWRGGGWGGHQPVEAVVVGRDDRRAPCEAPGLYLELVLLSEGTPGEQRTHRRTHQRTHQRAAEVQVTKTHANHTDASSGDVAVRARSPAARPATAPRAGVRRASHLTASGATRRTSSRVPCRMTCAKWSKRAAAARFDHFRTTAFDRSLSPLSHARGGRRTSSRSRVMEPKAP